jgi:hypothetical protein
MSIYSFDTNSIGNRVRRLEGYVPYRRAGELVPGASDFTSVPNAALDSSGNINLASSTYSAQGALAPTVADGNFAATATTTSITWYWDGTNGSTQFKLRRPDAVTQTGNTTCLIIPKGSITVTGLALNTKYYFLPFWPTLGACAPGWVIGDTGTPKIAIATPTAAQLAQQTLKNREALSAGFMSYTTPAAGTSSGDAGDGGGPGTGGIHACVMRGTAIEPLGESDYWVNIWPESQWIGIATQDGLTLNCTLDHPLYGGAELLDRFLLGKDLNTLEEDALKPFLREAGAFQVGDKVLTRYGLRRVIKAERFTRVCTKRQVSMTYGHLFWANGYLSHNIKANIA